MFQMCQNVYVWHRLQDLYLVTFNTRHQIIIQVLGEQATAFFGGKTMQRLLIPSFSRQNLIILTLFWSMLAVSAMAD